MHLTYHTDYALRLLMLLAVEPDRLHTIKEVSKRYQISKNHMMKVVHTLTEAGFVSTVRGRHGGLKLANNPEDINLGKIIRATEDNLNLVECFSMKNNKCQIAKDCGLRDPLNQALRAFIKTLDGFTLKDIVLNPRNHDQMRTLFPSTDAK